MAQVRKIDSVAPDSDTGPEPPDSPLCVVDMPPLAAARPPPLTRREVECLGWCADGKSYWETAVILGISERTVSFHMEAVRGKLKAATNAHAVAVSLRAGLLDSGTRSGAGNGRASQRGLR
jgi:DNA-binding CsgD family transcriptional regulator